MTLLSPQLLLSVDSLAPHAVEIGVVLAAARRFCGVCLSGSASGRGGGKETEERRGEGEKETVRDDENVKRIEEEDGGRRVKKRKRSKLSEVGGGGCVEREGEESASEEDERLCFVRSLSEMFYTLTKEPQRFMSGESSSDQTVSLQTVSLQSILGKMTCETPVFVCTRVGFLPGSVKICHLILLPDAPLEMPTESEIVATAETTDPSLSSSPHWPLLPALVSSIDCG